MCLWWNCIKYKWRWYISNLYEERDLLSLSFFRSSFLICLTRVLACEESRLEAKMNDEMAAFECNDNLMGFRSFILIKLKKFVHIHFVTASSWLFEVREGWRYFKKISVENFKNLIAFNFNLKINKNIFWRKIYWFWN